MSKEQYAGTQGLNASLAFNRLCELMDKQPLGEKDVAFYNEAKSILGNELDKIQWWNSVEEKLTAKQMLHVLKDKKNG